MAKFLRIDRTEFFTRYFSPDKGEHILILGPTGSGKTQLILDMTGIISRPKRPALIFAMKPRDATLDNFAEVNNFKETKIWPPLKAPWGTTKPNGYIVKPHQIPKDIDATELIQYRVFKEAILDSYAKGHRIIVADETYSLTNELGLGKELVTVWTKGRSNDCVIVAASQRPVYIPTWAYSQSSHFFIAWDPDKRSRKRYEEISGVDPELIAQGTQALEEYEWLYVRAKGRRSELCIVSA